MADKFELNSTTPAAPAGKVNIVWQSDAAGNISGHTAGVVASVFGRTGAVVAQSGDYGVAQVTGAVPDTRTIIAGSGLSGGGALSGNVTLSANIAGIQTPWLSAIDAAGFALNNTGNVLMGAATGPGSRLYVHGGAALPLRVERNNTAGTLDGISLARDTSVFGDSMDIVWQHPSHGAGTAYGRLECIVAVSPDASTDFVFHGRPTGGLGGYSHEVVRIRGKNGIKITGWNAGGIDAISGLVLERGYDAVGDSMDIVWPSTARLSVQATGGGEAGFIFYAQTAAGNGETNEAMRVQGNGVIRMLLGGSLKTLSVDGSGFVKAT